MKLIVLFSAPVFLFLPDFGAPENAPQRDLRPTTIRLDPQRDRIVVGGKARCGAVSDAPKAGRKRNTGALKRTISFIGQSDI